LRGEGQAVPPLAAQRVGSKNFVWRADGEHAVHAVHAPEQFACRLYGAAAPHAPLDAPPSLACEHARPHKCKATRTGMMRRIFSVPNPPGMMRRIFSVPNPPTEQEFFFLI